MIDPGHPCVTINRQRVRLFDRTWINDIESVDIRLRKCGSAFSFASHLRPVVVLPPITREFLHRCQPHTLRIIGDRFPFGQRVAAIAPAQIIAALGVTRLARRKSVARHSARLAAEDKSIGRFNDPDRASGRADDRAQAHCGHALAGKGNGRQ